MIYTTIAHSGTYTAPRKTQDQIESFILTTTGDSIKIADKVIEKSDIEFIDDPRLNIDSSLIAKMKSQSYKAEYFTYIDSTNIGSGIGTLRVDPILETINWWPVVVDTSIGFVGVAFVGESFLPEFQKGGRAFVFTDIYNALINSANYNILELISAISSGKDLTKATLDLDTAGVKVSSGSKVYYSQAKGTDFIATITTEDSVSIEYFINGVSNGSGIFKTTDVNFSSLNDSVALKVIITGTDILTDSSTWTFIRKQPALLTLDTTSTGVGLAVDPDTIHFNSKDLPIFLKSDSANTITYSINGSASIIYSDSFNLSSVSLDTVIIVASATGSTVTTVSKKWVIIRDIPIAKLTASPGDTTYTTPTIDVTLSTDSGNIIYYTLDGTVPIIGTSSSFVTTGIVKVTGDMTITATAVGTGFTEKDSSWSYTCDLPNLDSLVAIPGNSSDTVAYLFGNSLDVILKSDAQNIKYLKGSSSKLDSVTNGLVYNTGDTIKINSSDGDTVYITALGYDSLHKSLTKVFMYVKQYLPILIADPSGTKFSGSLDVKLSISSGVWSNLKIYFTLDGSEPDSTDSLYSGDIKLDTTVTIKAIAYADNVMPSTVLTESYTLAAGSKSAWYTDRDGNGEIDGVTIDLTMDINSLPDSLTLISPFDSSEIITLQKSDMSLDAVRRVTATFPTPFHYYDSTNFQKAPLGQFFGALYDTTKFDISDSIAPIVVLAVFNPGEIITNPKPVIQHDDTLVVTFSEAVKLGTTTLPLSFIRGDSLYNMKLKYLSSNGKYVKFIVESFIDIEYPKNGDSVKVNFEGDLSDVNGVVQSNPNNLYAPVVVNELKFTDLIDVIAISPVNPSEFEIPDKYKSNLFNENSGVVIVVDFQIKLPTTESINATGVIFDQVGNVLASCSGINLEGDFVAEVKTIDSKTKLFFNWDGKNSNSRYVGSGMYLVKLTITDPNGDKIEKRISVGVME